jgi:biotin synthase-related radical SAM superfamily protein
MNSAPEKNQLPQKIRVSIGTAIVLGLLDGKLDASPTTAYLMTYKVGKCTANCGFCPQARASKSSADMLSRVSWPTFSTIDVATALARVAERGIIKRICIQALNYPEVFSELEALIAQIKKQTHLPLSISCQPINRSNIERLKKAGADRIGIALDGATETIFDKVKGKAAGGPHVWEQQFGLLADALEVFGKGNVSTHVVVGLGETEKEAVQIIQRCLDLGVLPALFAFTPIRGTALEKCSPPPLESYRRLQMARYLIVNGIAHITKMDFDAAGKITFFGLEEEKLKLIIVEGEPFRTSGCPGCNRPFYNEKPSGPVYNYPYQPTKTDLEKICGQLGV